MTATPGLAWQRHLATLLAISLGAILGANARYLVGQWSVAHWPTTFPWGTLIVNVTGSLVIGLVATLFASRRGHQSGAYFFVVTGFLGAYTTFSAFSYETVQLIAHGEIALALLYVAGTLALGLGAVSLGALVARSRLCTRWASDRGTR